MLANNVTKCGFAVAFGSAALRSRIVVSMLAIAGAALVALFVAGGSAAGRLAAQLYGVKLIPTEKTNSSTKSRV